MILVSKSLMVDVYLNKFSVDASDLCKANSDLSNPYSGFGNYDVDSRHFFYQLSGVTGNVYINDELPGTGVARLGDLELSGRQNLAITITGTDSSPKTIFFANKDCPESVTKKMTTGSASVDFSRCRYFERVTSMGKVESATTYSTSFFDFHELG